MNRSLKKIQNVLDSVQGMDGGLKFDTTSGGFVATSIIEEFDQGRHILIPEKNHPVQNPDIVSQIAGLETPMPDLNGEKSSTKFEDDETCTSGSMHIASSSEDDIKNADIPRNDSVEYFKPISTDPIYFPDNVCQGSYLAKEGKGWGKNEHSLKLKNFNLCFKSQSSSPLVAAREIEHNHPTSSMTDSSNGSELMRHGSSSIQSFVDNKQPVVRKGFIESGSKINVKATYKEDTVRFKFDASTGCLQLYEELGTRFRLQNGTFQLKYLDDEEEWVMLVNDLDLQVCLEILEDIGSHNVKFQVRDLPCVIGSSNCYLAGGL